MSTVTTTASTPKEWAAALAALPSTPENPPAFFFSHGSPALEGLNKNSATSDYLLDYVGPDGPLGQFLRDFGPTLLAKYKPKGIVVFSAHWETNKERLVTDYESPQPLYFDYYGFSMEMYQLKFNSKGSSELSEKVIQSFKQAGLPARLTKQSEPRGRDGRGYPGPGLDHGVFVPFRIMFGHEFMDVPIVEASIDGSLDPEANWRIGEAVSDLRKEGILILAGGLTVHTFSDFAAFAEKTAAPMYKDFHNAVNAAVLRPSAAERKEALLNLVKHKAFRYAHPREEHFIPLYVGAGAGATGQARIVCTAYGASTFAFGL